MAETTTPGETSDRIAVDKGDIQALAKSGLRCWKGAAHVLLRVSRKDLACAWLRGIEPLSIASFDEDLGAGAKPLQEIIQIAFTHAGLSKLGVSQDSLDGFSLEFREGMVDHDNRSRRLGDTGDNDPTNWNWGDPTRELDPHVLLMLFARREDEIDALVERVCTGAESAGLQILETLRTSNMHGHEPFGFLDGISQPSFDWLGRRETNSPQNRDYTNFIALGELLLGHFNEYGYLTERPLLNKNQKKGIALRAAPGAVGQYDLGLNGTYLVFRQLEQDVHGFWRWVAERANGKSFDKDSPDAWSKTKALAETMVGRRMNGAPLGGLETGVGIAGVDAARNDFAYSSDSEGLVCPLGAHIRRANPRTGDDPGGNRGPIDNLLASLGLAAHPGSAAGAIASTLPWPFNTSVWPQARTETDAVSSARFHRILRRGREYGECLDPREAAFSEPDGKPRGLNFICLNANIGRQFEFIQGAWIASSQFAALSGEQDPLLGNREPFPNPSLGISRPTDLFSIPSETLQRRYAKLPKFVTVRGGAYFFLPGLRALEWILAD